jgi:hypothetical protein
MNWFPTIMTTHFRGFEFHSTEMSVRSRQRIKLLIMEHIYDCSSMQPQLLDDWVASLLLVYNIRKIAAICHLSRDRIRAVRDAQRPDARLLHLWGRPAKATPEIKQAMLELTLQHPAFSDLQIAHLIT